MPPCADSARCPSNDLFTRELPRTEVRAKPYDATVKSASMTRMDHDQIMNTAGTANDLNRVLAINPGVTTNGTIEDNAIVVRGGSSAENAYIIDGMELENINHFFTFERTGGAIGFINADLVEKLDFYTGGIPASMPPKISSVIDIKLRDGSTETRRGQCDLNISGLGAVLEGGFFGVKGSYLANFRWNDMRFLKRFITEGDIPRFGDGLVKLVFHPSDRHVLEALGVASYDFFRSIPTWESDPDSKVYQKELSQGALGLSSKFTGNLFQNALSLSFTSIHDEYFEDYTGFIDTIGGNIPGQFLSTRIFSGENRRATVDLHEDISFFFGPRLRLDMGCLGRFTRYHVRHQENYFYWNSFGDSTVDGIQTGGYAQGTLKTGYVTVIAGLRGDYYSLITDYGVAPKIGIAVAPPDCGTFSINGGISYQLPPWIDQRLWYFLTPYHGGVAFHMEDFTLQRCWQGGIGYEKPFRQSGLVKTEAYIKWYDREYPYWYPEQAHFADSIQEIDGKEQWRLISPHGKKRAFGLEVSLKQKPSDRFFYNMSASFASVRDQYINGLWYNDKNDVQAASTLILGSSIGKYQRISVRFSASQGRPYTTSGFDSTEYYTKRFDPVYSVNVRYGIDYQGKRMGFSAYLEALNVLNQTSFVYQEYYQGEYMNRRMNGILPLAGVTVSF